MVTKHKKAREDNILHLKAREHNILHLEAREPHALHLEPSNMPGLQHLALSRLEHTNL